MDESEITEVPMKYRGVSLTAYSEQSYPGQSNSAAIGYFFVSLFAAGLHQVE